MANQSETKTVVHINQICKRFGRTVAIEHLDLKVQTGEFVTLLGPSGCGKSTTLRMLGGFEKPDRGHIIISGQDVTDLPPNKRNVNMVFQDYALFPHMSVSQNIRFGLELKGLTQSQISAREEELLSMLQLNTLSGRRPDQLSGGQRQRVALARALAPDPDLLLLDEPLGALDARLRAQLQLELKDIQQRTGKTFIFVTHDQDEALTMSDRIIVMNEGLVAQDGSPEDLYLRPQNRFVAQFIGETNLIDGEVQSVEVENDAVIIDWHGLKLCSRTGNVVLEKGQKVTASLRPEKIAISNNRTDSDNTIEAQVINRVFKGSRTLLDVRVADASDAVLKAYVAPEVAAGLTTDQAWISWDGVNMTTLCD